MSVKYVHLYDMFQCGFSITKSTLLLALQFLLSACSIIYKRAIKSILAGILAVTSALNVEGILTFHTERKNMDSEKGK